MLLVVVPAARAADPIMPLSEVRQGMRCTGLSVIKGTTISSFDVEILDVIAPEAGLSGPRILIKVSGPAVDETGIGPGFSGSPVICDGRNAGAISEGLGEYGNHVALATPIEGMLADRPTAPASARRDPALLRAARPLQTPLTVSGLTGPARTLVQQAARQAKRPLLVAPAGPAGGYAPVDLQPGAALSAAISTGDLGLGAVGTVTYRDGDDIWAFGHPFEGLGRRALFLADAYIYTVIQNPIGVPELGAMTYKLASSDGHVLGSITSDTVDSIAGKVGSEPPSFPLHIDARNRAGERVTLDSQLSDERDLGYGAGISFVAPLGVTQALGRLMRDFGPVTFRMCARFRVRELRRPMGFCNTYFSVDDAVTHLSDAGAMIDFFDLGAAARGAHRDQRSRANRPQAGRSDRRARAAARTQGPAHPGAAHGAAPPRRTTPAHGPRSGAALAATRRAPAHLHGQRRRLLRRCPGRRADRDARGRAERRRRIVRAAHCQAARAAHQGAPASRRHPCEVQEPRLAARPSLERRELRGPGQADAAGQAPGAPVALGCAPFASTGASACSSSSPEKTDSAELLRMPSDDTSSLKS